VLNGVRDFFGRNIAANDFHFLTVSRDEETHRNLAFVTELARRLVASEQDGLIHRLGRNGRVKSLVLHESFDGFSIPAVYSDSYNSEFPGCELFLQVDEIGDLLAAGLAPRGPDIHEDDFSLIVRRVHPAVSTVGKTACGKG